jgi:chorismate mutase/prephenate dehydratase
MAAEAISLWIKENGAAIASKYAAVEYKLNILAENIQDQSDNITRFLIVTHKNSKVSFEKKRNKLSLHFTLKNWFQDFGHLFRIFDVYKANVVKMNLYPTWEQAFEQSVCMDIEFWETIDEYKACIDKISEYCSHIHILWVY